MGRFGIQLAESESAELFASGARHQHWIRGEGSTVVRAGDREVVVRARTGPYATLAVRVIDRAARAELERFQVSFTGAGLYVTTATQDGLVEVELPLGGPTETYRVQLLDPATGVAQEVTLRPHEQQALTLPVHFDQDVAGLVVDTAGLPIEGAVVFFGTLRDATGDEPFKPFDARRVAGVTTDAGGWFELASESVQPVTAWHPAYSPATVAAESAARIELPPTGRIEGSIDLEDGAELELRPARSTMVAAGHFAFADLPAGTHGLFLPDGTVYALTVLPGETLHFARTAAFDAWLELTSGGIALTTGLEGALVGLDAVGSCAPFELRHGKGTARGVLPGEHLLVAFGGTIAHVSVTAPDARIELGTAELIVQGPPAHTLMLLPAALSEHPFARTMAERVSRSSAAGDLIFAPLAAGRWTVEDLTTGTRTVLELGEGERRILALP